MVADAAVRRTAQFSIGRAITDSFRILWRNLIWFAVPALVIRLLWLLAPPIERIGGDQIIAEMNWSNEVVRPVLAIAVWGLVAAAIILGALQGLQGRQASLGDARRGLSSVVPLTVAGVIFCLPGMAPSFIQALIHDLTGGLQTSVGLQLAVLFGLMLLFIPFAILTLAWTVYAPAILVERCGAIAGLTRSSQLTKGRRWALLGLFVIVLIMYVALLVPIALIADVGITELLSPTTLTIAAAMGYVAQALLSAFSAVLLTVVYCYLRAEKEGIAIEEIAGAP